MQFLRSYHSPLGELRMTADEVGLTGLWLVGQPGFVHATGIDGPEWEVPVLAEAARWLDIYFSGRCPYFTPALHLIGTAFQCEVWGLLLQIPYGETVTYGALAVQLAARRGIPRMSAQAVGGAVGRNPISIILPCHRVIGADGSLVGYAGGVQKKQWLLRSEGSPGHDGAPRLSL